MQLLVLILTKTESMPRIVSGMVGVTLVYELTGPLITKMALTKAGETEITKKQKTKQA